MFLTKYKSHNLKNILLALYLILGFFIKQGVQNAVHAQEQGLGVARYLSLEDVESGDIISIYENKYSKSKIFYDPGVVGVVVSKPALAISSNDTQGKVAVLGTGQAKVKVSTTNGVINSGDVITSSDIPGVGAKLNRSGFAIGIANEGYFEEDPNKIGQISVDVNRNYAYSAEDTLTQKLQRSVTDVLVLSEIASYDSPTQILRYLMAGIILIASVILGITTFGKIARAGVEAIGRNPLAGKSISFGIALNVLITVAIITGGIALGYFILVF